MSSKKSKKSNKSDETKRNVQTKKKASEKRGLGPSDRNVEINK